MSAIAVERPRDRAAASFRRGIGRGLLFLVVLAMLYGLWEGYRWLWEREAWTWPFVVDDTTMPHLDDIVAALWASARPGGVGWSGVSRFPPPPAPASPPAPPAGGAGGARAPAPPPRSPPPPGALV